MPAAGDDRLLHLHERARHEVPRGNLRKAFPGIAHGLIRFFTRGIFAA